MNDARSLEQACKLLQPCFNAVDAAPDREIASKLTHLRGETTRLIDRIPPGSGLGSTISFLIAVSTRARWIRREVLVGALSIDAAKRQVQELMQRVVR